MGVSQLPAKCWVKKSSILVVNRVSWALQLKIKLDIPRPFLLHSLPQTGVSECVANCNGSMRRIFTLVYWPKPSLGSIPVQTFFGLPN